MKTLRCSLWTLLVLAVSFQWILASEDAQRTKTFKVEKGGKLEVVVSGGDIAVSTWDKNEVFVRADGIDDEDLQDLEMTQSGNTVRVEFKPDWRSSSEAKFVLSIPVQFDADLRTAGGDIELKGNLTGALKATTAGGDISTGDINGKTTLKTSGGDIRMGAVNDDASVSTSGGDIVAERVGKSLKASTAGGDITIGDVGGDASVSTAGGDIEVGKVAGSAKLSTAGGDILLKSASGSVSARTAGGDLKLFDVYGTVEGKTAGGDVKAVMYPTGTGSSDLETAGGDIEVTIPENAKATIEATIEVRGSRRHWEDKYDIKSDFKAAEYEKDKEHGRIYGKYVLNGGGAGITLKTSSGNIVLKKAAGK